MARRQHGPHHIAQYAATALFLAGCGDTIVAPPAWDPNRGSESESGPPAGPDLATAGSDVGVTDETDETGGTGGTGGTDDIELGFTYTIEVLLDGQPAAGVTVSQGGAIQTWITEDDGRATVTVDREIPGSHAFFASHPDARILSVRVPDEASDEVITINLNRVAEGDNEAYIFQEAGSPTNRQTSAYCAHCHKALSENWWASPHRSAASSAVVQDIYAGVSTALHDESSCTQAGGRWWTGIEPGTGEPTDRCYIGQGTLPDLNAGCGDTAPCDETAVAFGGCADCHAPGINGKLGGRDLLEARGSEFSDGVHCDVCHKVESINPDGAPGIAGRLVIKRPTEESLSPSLGQWLPLTYGPYTDVSNPRMGSVARDFFRGPELCSGCHQLDQPVLLEGESADLDRWPDGRIPIHSTYEEWLEGPLNPSAPCTSCHMPPDVDQINSSDFNTSFSPNAGSGWPRPPGAVREHSWVGPRTPESGMLELAAAIFIDKQITGNQLETTITVKNVGPGHAIPTGEPMRSLVVQVEARCADTALAAVGGDAIPGFSGALDRRESPEDWSTWPSASVGDVVRVITLQGGWYDYHGPLRFGDGSFTAQEKGMPIEAVVGMSTITAVNGDQVTFDTPLPVGDVAYRGTAGLFAVTPNHAGVSLAGAPGFAFARVLSDPQGAIMVPHYRAIDVVSDNRLRPQESWTSTHVFQTTCAEPTVHAVLIHQAYPTAIARERGWDATPKVMVNTWK